eukprot:CAMPEP_0115559140 /NCGR_PEP_ID=MMETSP0271-20121206/99807_1 /TAXON_ID=71861 /ORGANISM="Scrippsiella trochoidea, Strain CCMP3099" /LENGTH=140 /DNA_ID=CAMNT_0002993191 /DNA_START=27 /DNA_END=449 /DNA_ORIENTATION=-
MADPESAFAPIPENPSSARTGRRRRARNLLRGFLAEAAVCQSQPRRRRPVSIAEIVGGRPEESDGEAAMAGAAAGRRVRSSPKVRFNPVVMECPFTPTNVAGEDGIDFGSLSSSSGEERHGSGSSEESGDDENADTSCCE